MDAPPTYTGRGPDLDAALFAAYAWQKANDRPRDAEWDVTAETYREAIRAAAVEAPVSTLAIATAADWRNAFKEAGAAGDMKGAALALAQRGFLIFPCDNRHKGPHGVLGRLGGLYWATDNPVEIEQWWGEAPEACIGLLMGRRTGVFAIDIDTKSQAHKDDGLMNFNRLENDLRTTIGGRAHTTAHGGIHKIFKWFEGGPGKISPFKVEDTEYRGVEIMGNGAFIVIPPSKLADGGIYNVKEECAPPIPPKKLQGVLGEQPKFEPEPGPSTDKWDPEWCRAKLEEIVAEIAATEPHTYDDVSKLALQIGSLVAGGGLDDAVAWAALSEAASASDKPRDYLDKVRRPYEKGKRRPWSPRHQSNTFDYDDFFAYMPTGTYMWMPSREFWTAKSVNARLKPKTVTVDAKKVKIPPSVWLDRHSPVTQISWVPGEEEFIRGEVIELGGRRDHVDGVIFNSYIGPNIKPIEGDASMWVNHWARLYPDDWETAVDKLAFKVQYPGVKVNHALLIGGGPGVGKDTLLAPVREAVGPWNFIDISPNRILEGTFNEYRKAVFLRISEAKDLGDFNRYNFYETTKTIIASPPEVLEVNAKYVRQVWIPNVLDVIITTNHETTALYLPRDDRRHYVLWTNVTKEEFKPEYWNALWDWYENRGGYAIVAHYLLTRDLSKFNPKAPPRLTEAFWAIVGAGESAEGSDLGDLIEAIGRPRALTLAMLAKKAETDFHLQPEFAKTVEWLKAHPHITPSKFGVNGYRSFRNKTAKDGKWKIGLRSRVVYVWRELTDREAEAAVRALQDQRNEKSPSDQQDKVINLFDP
jgi:Bifunctional DNA primase/polymerase, N-terminal/Family of unknown function (DUF5906)